MSPSLRSSLALRSFEPPSGIIVPTQRRLASVISFSSGQLLGTPENANRLLQADPQPNYKFALFSEEFIKLQIVTTQALTLPVATGTFSEKYGTFGSEVTVTACVKALDGLSKHCAKFGNPAKLATEIQVIGRGEKPATLYGRIVWLAYKIANTSQTFGLNFMTIAMALQQIPTPAERLVMLRQILTGTGGLVTQAKTMETESASLRDALLTYTTEMTTVKAPISKYFSDGGTLCEEARSKHKDILTRITQAQNELNTAREDYIKYCAAAAGSSVGLMIISGGMAWPLAATAGGVLGAMAEEARKRANEIEGEISRLNAEGAKKARLVLDVQGLHVGVTPIELHLGKVIESLGTIAGVWGNVASQFQDIVNETKPEDLQNVEEYTAASRIITAQGKWKEIAETTSQFTERAFVQVQPSAA